MKTFALVLIFVFWFSASAQQNPTPTPFQAKEFLNAHINPIVDISEDNNTYSLLRDHKPGDIIIDGQNLYKIVEITTVTAYNAGYIYLDAAKLSEYEIKQLTDDILSQYNSGVSFSELAKKYSMDKNPNAGELKFREGQMVGTFEKAVKEHAPGEVFTVVTPEKKWFHIVKKNEADRIIKAINAEYAIYKPS